MSSFTPYERIIVLALDSVCWELLQPFAADATMPTLAALLKISSHGVLDSTVPPHTAAAWTTFLTGKDPGHHGIIDFVGFDPVAHRFKFHTSSVSRADSILSRLSADEISCGSIFLPRSYPPYPLHEGYMISGFETPDTESKFAEPAELKDEVLGLSPQLHFNFEDDWEEDRGDNPAFARNIERAMNAVDLLERLAVHFQRERPVKLQVAYLQATDILFHKAWRWCDPKTSVENPFRAEQIKKFFRRVDQLINRVLGVHSSSSTSGRFRPGGTQDRTLRVIVSDHGHGSSNGRIFINNLLQEWGYLAPLGGLRRASRRLRMLTMSAEDRRIKSREIPLDWSRTKAYLAHVGIYGFVYLNLKGREAHGIVTPGEFVKLRDQLIAKFKAAKIPGTDQPLFLDAIKGETVYARKKELNLPDIVLVPADGFYPRKKLSRGQAVRVTPKAIGGVHRSEGVYLFQGAGIVSGAPTQRASIADIAPTLLTALGRPVPASMTGKVMSHVFQQAPKIETVKDKGAAAQNGVNESVYSREEEKAIEKRLSDLGYLE